MTATFFVYVNNTVVLTIFFSTKDFCLQHTAKMIFNKSMELLEKMIYIKNENKYIVIKRIQ